MFCISSFMFSNLYIPHISTSAITTAKICHQSRRTSLRRPSLSKHCRKPRILMFLAQLAVRSLEEETNVTIKTEPKLKWRDIGSDVTEDQKQAISQLPPKMTNRCKAVMKQIICFSPQDGSLSFLLASWVKVMKPDRADWLSVLKELKRLENPLLFEITEHALLEDSFEANVRDYTKLINAYAKHGRFHDAEDALRRMKGRGLVCDQVTLTVLIHMHGKSGDLDRARECFDEIGLLGLFPDRRSYGSMMMAYIRAGEPALAEELMRETVAQEVYAGPEVYKALLRAYSGLGDADGAQRVFDGMQLSGVVPDDRICALLVNAYCVAGRSGGARSVVENMRGAGVPVSDKCVALVIGAYEREGELGRAMEFLAGLEEGGVGVGEEAAELMAGWFRRLGVVDEVEKVLRDFSVDPL